MSKACSVASETTQPLPARRQPKHGLSVCNPWFDLQERLCHSPQRVITLTVVPGWALASQWHLRSSVPRQECKPRDKCVQEDNDLQSNSTTSRLDNLPDRLDGLDAHQLLVESVEEVGPAVGVRFIPDDPRPGEQVRQQRPQREPRVRQDSTRAVLSSRGFGTGKFRSLARMNAETVQRLRITFDPRTPGTADRRHHL